jgi:hypothetical protein
MNYQGLDRLCGNYEGKYITRTHSKGNNNGGKNFGSKVYTYSRADELKGTYYRSYNGLGIQGLKMEDELHIAL